MSPPAALPGVREPEPYFDLQLRFAEAVASLTACDFGDAVAQYTTLHRRFALGIVPANPTSPEWQRYLHGLRACTDHGERLTWTASFYDQCGPEPPPPGQHVFGCFGCNPPTEAGVVRIHFGNRDRDATSPLAEHKVARRREELAAMFEFVHAAYPNAVSVRGTSWLYNVAAYRRLFPPEYVASRRAPETPLYFHGSSSWGQFLDHRGGFKAGPGAQFLRNLAVLRPERLREVFPLPALLVTAPIAAFRVPWWRDA